jgi:hypothetical protein
VLRCHGCLPHACNRLTALDLVQRELASLIDEPHSFQLSPQLEQLLRHLYASAAARVALLAQQLGQREQQGGASQQQQVREGCA